MHRIFTVTKSTQAPTTCEPEVPLNYNTSDAEDYGAHGCRHVQISDGKKRKLLFHLGEVTVPPFGVSVNYGVLTLKMNISDLVAGKLTEFSAKLAETASENSTQWFARCTSQNIDSKLAPLFLPGKPRQNGDGLWPPILRVKLGKDLFQADFDAVLKKTLRNVVVSCGPIYILQDGRWGMKLELESFYIEEQDTKASSLDWVFLLHQKNREAIKPKQIRRSGSPPPSPVKRPLKKVKTQREQNNCFGCQNDRPSQRDHMGLNGCCNVEDE